MLHNINNWPVLIQCGGMAYLHWVMSYGGKILILGLLNPFLIWVPWIHCSLFSKLTLPFHWSTVSHLLLWSSKFTSRLSFWHVFNSTFYHFIHIYYTPHILSPWTIIIRTLLLHKCCYLNIISIQKRKTIINLLKPIFFYPESTLCNLQFAFLFVYDEQIEGKNWTCVHSSVAGIRSPSDAIEFLRTYGDIDRQVIFWVLWGSSNP